MMFVIRAGLQILADHPRLYLNSGSRPDTEWLRLRGPVPPDAATAAMRTTSGPPRRIRSHCRNTWGIPGFRHSVGLARWWHFSFDLLWVVNGVVFYLLLFSTGEWKRLVPNSFDVFPNAVSTALQYLSLQLPENAGFSTYNALQLLAYFITVFIAAPVALITGLLRRRRSRAGSAPAQDCSTGRWHAPALRRAGVDADVHRRPHGDDLLSPDSSETSTT